ncbi:hypothetical protein DPEC_G00303920 [Dallia pectoralis]|uniref:Uncharacterized protein n=1 Tax=Dallia pectoralis TaxID=75939 RepID=A0ACC2FDD9_DALPE|nr:hypothetical protein DPEC_G00303920 [Dallia pectoralis]
MQITETDNQYTHWNGNIPAVAVGSVLCAYSTQGIWADQDLGLGDAKHHNVDSFFWLAPLWSDDSQVIALRAMLKPPSQGRGELGTVVRDDVGGKAVNAENPLHHKNSFTRRELGERNEMGKLAGGRKSQSEIQRQVRTQIRVSSPMTVQQNPRRRKAMMRATQGLP